MNCIKPKGNSGHALSVAFFGHIGLKFQWPANSSVARNDKRCLGGPRELLRGDCSRRVRSGLFGVVLLDPGLRMGGNMESNFTSDTVP